MSTYIVNTHNWRSNRGFVEFLTFYYTPAQEVSKQCGLLLPIAVAEERLLGSIKELILRDAFEIWNKPVQAHAFYFIPTLSKWTYKGVRDVNKVGQYSLISHGRLVRPIPPGVFCKHPGHEMIPADLHDTAL